jgi:hypothetical protein
MKKILKEYELFEYEELSPEAKAYALKEFNKDNDYPWLEERVLESCIDNLEAYKIKGVPRVNFSLSYCQGDGAMFYGTFEWNGRTVEITPVGRYCHSYSKDIEILESIEPFDEPVVASEAVHEDFETIYQEICRDMKNIGYEHIEQENSEEAMISTCDGNEWLFTKDGKLFIE